MLLRQSLEYNIEEYHMKSDLGAVGRSPSVLLCASIVAQAIVVCSAHYVLNVSPHVPPLWLSVRPSVCLLTSAASLHILYVICRIKQHLNVLHESADPVHRGAVGVQHVTERIAGHLCEILLVHGGVRLRQDLLGSQPAAAAAAAAALPHVLHHCNEEGSSFVFVLFSIVFSFLFGETCSPCPVGAPS